MSDAEPEVTIGGRNRAEFVGLAAGMVMSSVLAKDACLAVNADMRADVLKRSAMMARQGADMLWDALVSEGIAARDGGEMYAEFAVRNLASVLGWWADLACRPGVERAANLSCAVLTSVRGAAALYKELGRT